MRTVDEPLVIALASAAGLELLKEDIELLTRSLRRYATVTAKLDRANLDGFELPPSNDPRVGW